MDELDRAVGSNPTSSVSPLNRLLPQFDLVGGFYAFLPALATLLVPSLITFGIWSLFAGSRQYKLGKRLGGV